MVVRNMPDDVKHQQKAITKAIDREPDEHQRELMTIYNRKHGGTNPNDVRAKCFFLGEKRWKLRKAKPDDMFQDVVVPKNGHHYQIYHSYHSDVTEFREKCFAYTGARRDLTLAQRLWTNQDDIRERLITVQ